ncbi:MAG: hypothetical protein M1480_14365 [Bacteroidetes bacterium]|nr:hypothetical protein [Bacteroidota bacterium]
MKSSNPIDEKILEKIISTAYGDAGMIDKIRIYFYSLTKPEVKKLLNEYKQTANAIHSFNNLKCPEFITKTITKKVPNENREKAHRFAELFLRKPIIAAASFVIVAAIIGIIIYQNRPIEKTFSKVQAEIAERQVKQSLALIGQILKRNGNSLTEEIIIKQVTPPFHKSLETVNNLFKGG